MTFFCFVCLDKFFHGALDKEYLKRAWIFEKSRSNFMGVQLLLLYMHPCAFAA